jgi:hypothetical protein
MINPLSLSITKYPITKTGSERDATDQQRQLEQNKKNMIAFYDLMFNRNNPPGAIKRYVGETYIQRNPTLWPTASRLS